MHKEIIDADVLCIGGGVAGLMAAIRASELGVRVIVAEKGNTLRSGSGATGNDHFQCYIPEYHGTNFEAFMEQLNYGQMADAIKMHGVEYIRTWMLNTFDIVKLWDSWGIPMKYKGKWEFAGHHYPGQVAKHLKYAGQQQKPILTRETLKRGSRIINRVMIIDLITEGNVIGALGIDTRENRLIGFRAKSVILGTGRCVRIWPSPTPGWISNMSHAFGVTGDGRAMAYRAGAELMNMEIIRRHAGPKYLARCGQATWIGVLKDTKGKLIGPFVDKPDRRYGDMMTELYKSVFEDYMKSGRGPIYMDCTDLSNDDYEYMTYWLSNEGNSFMLDHMKGEGIDIRVNPIEFMSYEPRTGGWICTDEQARASLPGLYAVGDESFNEISPAAVFGRIAGENAARLAKERDFAEVDKINAKMDEKIDFIGEVQSRKAGPDWKEVNIALQQLMYDYAGPVRSETLLAAGSEYLRRLADKAQKTVIARSPHELAHCFEVFDLLDLSELIIVGANERKETRGLHVRTDYPFTNPLLDKSLIIKKINNKPVTEWRSK